MKKKNVLIYPCGAENAIEVYYSIKDSLHLNVIPANGKIDHSELIYDNPVQYLPYIQQDNFIDELNNLIEAQEIDFIFPTHDTVALYLAENAGKINCIIIGSGADTNRICRHKKDTYELFEGQAFCPSIYNKPADKSAYPLFAKPNVGEGSKGVALVETPEEHAALLTQDTDLVFAEYLPGREFTIDCFTNKDGELLFAGPRERVEVKMGISFKSEIVKDTDKFVAIAKEINTKLTFRGLWFFQLKEDKDGNLKLLEVSTRVATTMGLFRHRGVNLPLLSVFDAMGFAVEAVENSYDVTLFRSTKNRYKYSFDYKRVYLDFDDTLIINDKVSPTVISFVYQCKNLGKEVYLITKHAYDLNETLERYKISPALFDKILILKMEDIKSAHMETECAIFIDNWYKERKEVKEKYGIPVFDVDAVGSLMIN